LAGGYLLVVAHGALVLLQVSVSQERPLAAGEVASELLGVVVLKKVVLQGSLLVELFVAAGSGADEGEVFVVGLHVVFKGVRSLELFIAGRECAGVRSIL